MGNRIRELREKKQLSQVRLSIELNVSQETVSAYESGKHYPSYTSLVKLSEIFGVGIDYLMGRTGTPCTGSLSIQEEAVIYRYRLLGETGKIQAEAYMQGLLDAGQREAFQ